MNWIELIVHGGLAPGLTAAAVTWAARASARPAARWLLPAFAMAIAFCVAYALLPWAPLKPESPWHWLPLLAALGFGFGMLGCSKTERLPWRWLAVRFVGWLLFAVIAAWLLVPTWERLTPLRYQYVAALAAAIALTAAANDHACRRSDARLTLAVWLIGALGAAILLGLSGSVKFAQLGGVFAASIAGCLAVAAWRGSSIRVIGATGVVAGLHLGLVFTGWVYSFSSIGAASYLLVAGTPLLPQISAMTRPRNASPRPWIATVSLLTILAAALAMNATAIALAIQAE